MNTTYSFFRGVILVLFLTFILLIISTLPVFAVPEAHASGGFPMYSWGGNSGGRLGLGHTNQVDIPTRVGTADNWVLVVSASGGSHAINTYGQLYTFGANQAQRGLGPRPNIVDSSSVTVPTRITNPARDWRHVSARSSVSAAITTDNHLYTWGSNSNGQLGLGIDHTLPNNSERWTPTRVPGGYWDIVTCGSSHMLAINTDGYLYSWGSNANGRLGHGTTASADSVNVPTRVGNENNWVDIAVADGASLAINSDGYLYTWGHGTGGQLGRLPAAHSGVPTRVPGLSNVIGMAGMSTGRAVAVIANGDHVSGYVYTFGTNTHGQLGLGSGAAAQYNTPQRVGDRSDWTMIMGGNYHVVAMCERGNLYSWGRNQNGQLGLGDSGDNYFRNEPTLLGHVTRGVGAANGGGSFTIALLGGFMEGPAPEAEFILTKHLQKPEGTPAPNVTFTFTVERNSFNGNTTPADIARIPEIGSITLNPTTVVSPAPPPVGTVTLRAYTDILDGILFEEVGTFSWTISELQSATGIGPDSSVVFSQAQYDLRVYVFRQPLADGGNLYIRYITLHRIQNADGSIPGVEGGREKVNNLIFVNLYTYDPLVIPTGLFLTSGSPYLVFLATGALVTAYLSRRARKRIEELPLRS